MRRPSRSKLPRISAEQARQALHVLVADGKLASREVVKALERREKLVRELRERLTALGDEVSGRVARAGKGGPFPMMLTAGGRKTLRRRARKRVSRARRAAMKAQGRYMAAIHRLSKASRAKVKAIRKSSGVAAAIAAAKKMAARS